MGTPETVRIPLETIAVWFQQLYDTTGINLTIIYDGFDRRRFLWGLLTTVELTAICIALSLVIGVVGAWAQGVRSAAVRKAVQVYIQFFRNTPQLVQLYFFYFALGELLDRKSTRLNSSH